MPEVARMIYRIAYPRIGVLRAMFFEGTSLTPDAEDTVRELLTMIVGSVGAYVLDQMAQGRIRRMHPLLALQLFVGPIIFHAMTRQAIERMLTFDLDGDDAVTQLADSWLRAMQPDKEEAA